MTEKNITAVSRFNAEKVDLPYTDKITGITYRSTDDLKLDAISSIEGVLGMMENRQNLIVNIGASIEKGDKESLLVNACYDESDWLRNQNDRLKHAIDQFYDALKIDDICKASKDSHIKQ